MSKSREQRVAESIARSNRRSFEPVVKKVQLSNEYLARKVCPDIEAAVRACKSFRRHDGFFPPCLSRR